MKLQKQDRVALANFSGHLGCSGEQPVYMRLVKAGYLIREEGGLHDHSFHWAPGGEELAVFVRNELAVEILQKLSLEALKALQEYEEHPELVKKRLGFPVNRKTRPLMRTPLGHAIVALAEKAA